MKTTAMLMFTAALAGLQVTSTDVRADQKFKETVTVEAKALRGLGEHALTFSGPVSLPGMSLAPGTYIFRYPLGNVVQVSNTAGQAYKMFITIPTIRRDAPEGYSVVLGPPASPDAPMRIVALFTPGERTGHEFVYPAR